MRLLLTTALIAMALPLQAAERFETDLVPVEAETVAEMANPWGMSMLPSGDILVTERDGRLWRVTADGAKTEISGVPRVAASGQGGLLDVAVDPQFADNARIFFTFSEPGRGGAGTALASATLSGDRLDEVRVLFSMNKKTGARRHFGSRIVFGPNDTVFVTTGDRGDGDRAQDPFDHAGSVIRLNRDGSVPADNPFANGQAGAPDVWSFGHRNIQGAAIQPETAALFTVEHGARGGDEINTPQAGRNYGWPVISYGRHYSGAEIGEGTAKEGLEQPLHYWDPSIAPSGMAFGSGSQFPEWNGHIFVGALKDRKLVRLVFDGDKPVPAEILFEDQFGRIRDVDFFADGYLYLLTDENPGALIRVTPGD